MKFFLILFLLVSCAEKVKKTSFQGESTNVESQKSSENFDRGLVALCKDEAGNDCGKVAEENVNVNELNLIAGTDFDSSFNIARANNVVWTLYSEMQNTPRATRNNKYNDVVFGWRASADAVTVRKPVAQFGAGTFAKSGMSTNSARGTVTFRPNMPRGTYYFYFKFSTNGEDVNTSIFRIVIQ